MLLLILYLLLALIVSFLCSIMEAVLLSTPISYLKAGKKSGKYKIGGLLKYKKEIDKPLSAILSLNTIAHTIGAAGVGAQAVKVFGEAYFGIISAVLTILILIITEIIPKTIGAGYWKNLIVFVGILIKGTIIITYPLVIASSYITKFFAKKTHDAVSGREEISALADLAKEEGIFLEKENKIIQNVLKLKQVKVSDIMTPRVVVSIVDESMSLEEFLKNKDFMLFSRIPVYKNEKDNITGYVFRQTVFEKLAEESQGLTLRDIKHEIIIVPENKPIFGVWEKLLENKEHLALAVNEYGGMEGIVTMEDIIETLLGFEIIDEKDLVSDMQKYAKERWEKRKAKYTFLD